MYMYMGVLNLAYSVCTVHMYSVYSLEFFILNVQNVYIIYYIHVHVQCTYTM